MRRLVTVCFLLGTVMITGCKGETKRDLEPMKITGDYTQHTTEDFSQKKAFWQAYEGRWIWRDGVLAQTATDAYFPLILRTKEPFSALDLSVKFKPLSGDIDASGGVVFRAQDKENYYIVRANALEDNFRLYTFVDGRRSQIASARVTEPTLGSWHTIRVVAQKNHIQAYLDGVLYIDHHDGTFVKGYIGLWTKADSVTLFDDIEVKGR